LALLGNNNTVRIVGSNADIGDVGCTGVSTTPETRVAYEMKIDMDFHDNYRNFQTEYVNIWLFFNQSGTKQIVTDAVRRYLRRCDILLKMFMYKIHSSEGYS
jgi:hypothetical protein